MTNEQLATEIRERSLESLLSDLLDLANDKQSVLGRYARASVLEVVRRLQEQDKLIKSYQNQDFDSSSQLSNKLRELGFKPFVCNGHYKANRPD